MLTMYMTMSFPSPSFSRSKFMTPCTNAGYSRFISFHLHIRNFKCAFRYWISQLHWFSHHFLVFNMRKLLLLLQEMSRQLFFLLMMRMKRNFDFLSCNNILQFTLIYKSPWKFIEYVLCLADLLNLFIIS